MRRAVFLDRDGVINRAIVRDGKPYPPASLSDLEILPGVHEALQKLHVAKYLLIVVTNQPDVARGSTKREVVEEINAFLSSQLPIDDFKTCYHDTSDKCKCRKPQPGAIIETSNKFNIDLTESYMIGDRWTDIEAGLKAGCKTIYIDYDYNEQKSIAHHFTVNSLMEAKKIILKEI